MSPQQPVSAPTSATYASAQPATSRTAFECTIAKTTYGISNFEMFIVTGLSLI